MLPSNVGKGTVTGRLIDSHGTNIEGRVSFTPSPKRLLNVGATPPTTILPKPIEVALVDGAFTTELVATDDPDNNPSGWTYRVAFRLNGAVADSFDIAVPEGSTVDITTVAPVASAQGATIVRGAGVPEGGEEGQVLAVVAGEPTWTEPPASGGGGTDLTAYSQVSSLADYPATFPPAEHDHDARYVRTVNNTAPDGDGNVTVTTGDGGVTDHGALTGLGDDDHPQYLTQARGDARYMQPADVPAQPTWSTLSGKPAVIAAGTSMTAARDAIGAGTSNLQLGTGPTTAAAGDHGHDLNQVSDTATRVAMTPAERTKLSGVATGATANATDAQLRDRSTHTGAQAISTVTGLQTALDSKQAAGSYAAGTHSHTATDISNSTATGRSVLTAADAAAARTAIGAGTSSLALGTTASTAKAGNYTPPVADLPAGSVVFVRWTGSAWPARPTARTDILCHYVGGSDAAAPTGMVAGDVWTKAT